MENNGYNPVNTLVYGLIALFVLWFLYPKFKKEKNLVFLVIGFILLGSGLRVFEDLGFFPRSCDFLEFGFYTITPGIYILIGGFFVSSYLLASRFSIDKKYVGYFGFLLGGIVSLFWILNGKEFFGFLLALGLSLLIYFFVIKIFKIERKIENKALIFGQILDSSTTSVAVGLFSCGEQHFVSAFILELHPVLFILLKIVLAVLVIKIVDKEKDKDFGRFVKVAVAVLGLATGTRDILTLLAGTCN